MAEDDCRLDHFARFGVVVLIVRGESEGSTGLLGDRGAVDAQQVIDPSRKIAAIFLFSQFLDLNHRPLDARIHLTSTGVGVDSVDEGSQLIKLSLGPFIERMVVALGATDSCAEEDANGIVQVRERHAGIAKHVADGRILPSATLGGQKSMNEFVVRQVRGEGLFNPFVVGLVVDIAPGLVLQPQDVGPEIETATHVAWRTQKFVDQVRSFVSAPGPIQKLRGLPVLGMVPAISR